jgi:hypothetical protein
LNLLPRCHCGCCCCCHCHRCCCCCCCCHRLIAKTTLRHSGSMRTALKGPTTCLPSPYSAT